MTEALPRRASNRTSSPTRRRRKPRVAQQRASGLPGTLGITTLGALLPGSGFVFVGRRYLGLLVLLPTLTVGILGSWYVFNNVDSLVRLAVDPDRLTATAVVMVVLIVAWATVIIATYRMVHPKPQPRWQSFVGAAFVAMLCLFVAAPLAIGARYSLVQKDLVETVFKFSESTTRPPGVTEENPWGDRNRVNVLLLGGDGGVDREGVRTDSMILASMNVKTGDTVLFSLPRNLMNVPFKAGSPLDKRYPDGFGGEGDDGEWMLNAVYRNVPALHPGVLGKTDNEGADALKLAVGGALGLNVHYYLLVNLNGFEEIVDAMGGVTVNVNHPIPIGGNTDLGIPPDGYLPPGPKQRLDGFEALWFARGRYGLDDYNRMERQRCMMNAIVHEADPVNLLRRYQDLAATGKKIIRTDIPRKLLPAFVDLTMEVKDRELRSVVFRSSEEFSPGDPDYDWMHSTVEKALKPPKDKPKRRKPGKQAEHRRGQSEERSQDADPDDAVKATDSCAYDPVE